MVQEHKVWVLEKSILKRVVYFNISLNNKTFISDIFFKVASLVINISAFASKEVAIWIASGVLIL